jgi:hypothetical protein
MTRHYHFDSLDTARPGDDCDDCRTDFAPGPDDYVVIDSATGRWLPGIPSPRLVDAGRGHALTTSGVWRLAEPDDDDEAAYRAVVIGRGRQVCEADGCDRTYHIAGRRQYVCLLHARQHEVDESPQIGVDKSTEPVVQSVHRPATKPATAHPGGARTKENPMTATKSRAMTKSEALRSGRKAVAGGMLDILNGKATADDVIADVEASTADLDAHNAEMDAMLAMPSESLGPVVNPDGTPSDVTVEMLTGKKPAPKAAAVRAVAPALPLITMETRDAILAGKDKALIARVNAGTYVRPNGSLPGGSVKSTGTDTKYYPRWRLAVDLTDAMLERVETVAPEQGWGWTNPDGRKPRERKATEVRESAAGAPRLDPVKVEKVAKAKATLAVIDALPGPESIIAIGSPEAQDALEVAAAASLGRSADVDGDLPF